MLNEEILFVKCFTFKLIQIYVITYPAPLGLTPQPCVSSGSDQRRSHIGPSWGTSCFLSIVLIWSNVCMLGDNPPCTQNI